MVGSASQAESENKFDIQKVMNKQFLKPYPLP